MELNTNTLIKEFDVADPWISLICQRKKVIEGRLNKSKFANLKKGDIIKFFNNDVNKQCLVKIVRIINYVSFEEYLVQEGLKRTLPGITSLNDGINIYRQFYSKEQEDEFSILAIYIKKINMNDLHIS